MTEKIVTIEGVAVRYNGKHCGQPEVVDGEEWPGDPCCCLVYDAEMEAFCFKFQDTLKNDPKDEEKFLRCAECKKEFGT